MKKITFVISCILLLANQNSNSQENNIEFGLKAGLNYSNFILSNKFSSGFPGEYNAKFGFHIGGFLNLKISEKLQFHPELLFSSQNMDYNYNHGLTLEGPDENYKASINQSLIIIPLMVSYFVTENFDIEFGPQPGYVIDQKFSDNNNNAFSSYSKFEVALNAGVGYSFAHHYRIGFRYNYGIVERDLKKTSVIQLSLCYKI